MIGLRHLRYFMAVAQERSFTHAAERVLVVQEPVRGHPPLRLRVHVLYRHQRSGLPEAGQRAPRKDRKHVLAHARSS